MVLPLQTFEELCGSYGCKAWTATLPSNHMHVSEPNDADPDDVHAINTKQTPAPFLNSNIWYTSEFELSKFDLSLTT